MDENLKGKKLFGEGSYLEMILHLKTDDKKTNERQQVVNFDLSKATVDLEPGKWCNINFGEDINDLLLQSVRQNGKLKTLEQVKNLKTVTSIGDPISTAIKKFDFCIALDTNTKEIENRKISCTSVYSVYLNNEGLIGWCEIGGFIFECRDNSIHPEKIGWLLTLDGLVTSSLQKIQGKQLLFITDHDLLNLEEVNKNKKFFFGNGESCEFDNFLTFMYASSDQGNLGKKIMKTCDKTSTHMLSYYLENDIVFPSDEVEKLNTTVLFKYKPEIEYDIDNILIFENR